MAASDSVIAHNIGNRYCQAAAGVLGDEDEAAAAPYLDIRNKAASFNYHATTICITLLIAAFRVYIYAIVMRRPARAA